MPGRLWSESQQDNLMELIFLKFIMYITVSTIVKLGFRMYCIGYSELYFIYLFFLYNSSFLCAYKGQHQKSLLKSLHIKYYTIWINTQNGNIYFWPYETNFPISLDTAKITVTIFLGEKKESLIWCFMNPTGDKWWACKSYTVQ